MSHGSSHHMQNFSIGEFEAVLDSLSLGDEVAVTVTREDEHLFWRIVHTRQGWQVFVDCDAGEGAHFEILTAGPTASRLLARAVIDGQMQNLLTARQSTIACAGVGHEEAWPASLARHLRPEDVLVTWLDAELPEPGARLKHGLPEGTTVDVRVRHDVFHLWMRRETLESTRVRVSEGSQALSHKEMLTFLRRRAQSLDSLNELGAFEQVQNWTFEVGRSLAVVESRQTWTQASG